MKSVKPAELERVSRLDHRFILLTGPDDATMGALATRLTGLAGKEAERLDLTSSQMSQDPSLLAAEAASMSLFAGARVIRLDISGSGDDCLAAVEALLGADSAINPASFSRCRISCQGCPILIPRALASLLRALAQPSLLESETTGHPFKLGRNTRSQLT